MQVISDEEPRRQNVPRFPRAVPWNSGTEKQNERLRPRMGSGRGRRSQIASMNSPSQTHLPSIVAALPGIKESSHPRMPSSPGDLFVVAEKVCAVILRTAFPQFLTGEDDQGSCKTRTPPSSYSLGSPRPPSLPADRSDFLSLEHSIRSLHLGFRAPLTNDSFVIIQLGMEGEGSPLPMELKLHSFCTPRIPLVTSTSMTGEQHTGDMQSNCQQICTFLSPVILMMGFYSNGFVH
ncbi:uncharacterized protein LOC103663149 [Ursus maritimus]|uniref:Uncharacterized protein LOC103663149 n=1 Tax=Ursus maritimus TaxID=29073 RepID=A0A384C2H2_URSMA|nr:uncharacterized protein LOC103663149 [Ursus maritimus]